MKNLFGRSFLRKPSAKEDLFRSVVLDMGDEAVSDCEIIRQIASLTDLEQRDPDGSTLLINAATYGRAEIVRFLLQRGSDIQTKDDAGFTALHAAVISNHLETVTLLVEAGCDVNATNQWGNPPLSVGNLSTDLRIFTLLVQHGADPSQKNNDGVSPREVFLCSPEISACLSGD